VLFIFNRATAFAKNDSNNIMLLLLLVHGSVLLIKNESNAVISYNPNEGLDCPVYTLMKS